MKKNITTLASGLLLVSILTGFTGCLHKVDTYSPKVTYKTNAISKLSINNGNEIVLTKYASSIMCSLNSSINTPSGESYSDYIENALVSELKHNNLYSKDNGLNLINIHLEGLESSSAFGDSYWQFEVRISSKATKDFIVRSRYDLDTHLKVDVACQEMNDSFDKAVAKLMKDIFKHPEFSSLFIR